MPVDCALTGILVPAGEHDLRLEFETPRFTLAALVSLVSALALAGILVLRRRDLTV